MDDTVYKPIAETFYATLEDLAARRKYCKVQYFTPIHEFITARAVVTGIVQEAGEEYLTLATGEQIRLDRLYNVDDNFAPGFENYHEFSCDC
ncbi:hypothetical protein [Adhaeribacter rhizoryzae]|uniref:Uncharacterized protein n=1 Tax=Adhaeribacter rhizoryzae TaxID=2607907 RepID=A0A5M6DBF4_9BACT|nr:hypothetical protein [Adhaeribacter rhizoryzae]KAA5542475.1 hypothetical protein F0145_18670 [Adhaeribacter rhizoryzae]